MSTPSTTPFVGSIAWASHSGGSPPRVEDPGYLPEVVAFAAQLAARRYRLGRAGLARLNQAGGAYGLQEPTWFPNHKRMRRRRLDRPTSQTGFRDGWS
jgi:hypothetical protein